MESRNITMNEEKSKYQYILGGPDAWDKTESAMLKDVFLETQQYEDISEMEAVFLCGRRGSGKSAIARMLAIDPRWKYASSFKGERSEYGDFMDIVQRLASLRDGGLRIDIEKVIRRIWGWTLRGIAMMTIIHLASENDEKNGKDINTIKKYIGGLPNSIHRGSSIGHVLNIVFSRTVEMVQEGTFDNYISVLNNSEQHVDALNALERITKRNRLVLVLDTLESYRIFENSVIEGFKGVLDAIIAFCADEQVHGISL